MAQLVPFGSRSRGSSVQAEVDLDYLFPIRTTPVNFDGHLPRVSEPVSATIVGRDSKRTAEALLANVARVIVANDSAFRCLMDLPSVVVGMKDIRAELSPCIPVAFGSQIICDVYLIPACSALQTRSPGSWMITYAVASGEEIKTAYARYKGLREIVRYLKTTILMLGFERVPSYVVELSCVRTALTRYLPSGWDRLPDGVRRRIMLASLAAVLGRGRIAYLNADIEFPATRLQLSIPCARWSGCEATISVSVTSCAAAGWRLVLRRSSSQSYDCMERNTWWRAHAGERMARRSSCSP